MVVSGCNTTIATFNRLATSVHICTQLDHWNRLQAEREREREREREKRINFRSLIRN